MVRLCPQKSFFAAKRLCTVVWHFKKTITVLDIIKISTDSSYRYLELSLTKCSQKFGEKKSTLLKIRKEVKILYLRNHWRKKFHSKTFYFFKNTRNHW